MKDFFKQLFPSKEERAAKAKERDRMLDAERRRDRERLDRQLMEKLNNHGRIVIDYVMGGDSKYRGYLERDAFTKDLTLGFEQVAGMFIGGVKWFANEGAIVEFGFRHTGGNHQAFLRCYQKELKMEKGDTLMLLLSSGQVIELVLENSGQRVDRDNEGIMMESSLPVSIEVLELLEQSQLQQWRYAKPDQPKMLTGAVRRQDVINLSDMTIGYMKLVDRFLSL